MKSYISYSEKDTIACGKDFGANLSENAVVCFFGDLGAGKTTFIKGVSEGFAGCSSSDVNSPTFVYLNIYKGKKDVYHFDLYRLKDSEEFLSMGFDEMFYAGGATLLEWSEKIENMLPENHIRVTILHLGESSRKITIEEAIA
ncbi:MAG TPA: tRNA (adenosine(37)-N6)-threonylcarbamoyltransferase complex ATPase subunit type 1 TsaE [Parachlamydiaceae bacterium]|nr:tRNA (adenosine(37)-N6)-threonylcarbamoyltransferase complex ATPase subunit type 1 TsaE [Parachlamydiaceae bacterium]